MEFRKLDTFFVEWLKNPDQNLVFTKYYTKKRILYYKTMVAFPIATIENGNLLFIFGKTYKKPLKKFLPIILQNKDLYDNFFLVSNLLKYNRSRKSEQAIRYEDISNMIKNYIENDIFYEFKRLNFDFVQHIFNYLQYYKSVDTWSKFYNNEVKIIHNRWGYEIGLLSKISDKNIVSEIANMERLFKIKSLLSI